LRHRFLPSQPYVRQTATTPATSEGDDALWCPQPHRSLSRKARPPAFNATMKQSRDTDSSGWSTVGTSRSRYSRSFMSSTLTCAMFDTLIDCFFMMRSTRVFYISFIFFSVKIEIYVDFWNKYFLIYLLYSTLKDLYTMKHQRSDNNPLD